MLLGQRTRGPAAGPAARRTPIGVRQPVRIVTRAADGNGPAKPAAGGDGGSLDDRIAAGEFSDTGSTKERLTRPVRKLLAQDPVGIGEGSGGRPLAWPVHYWHRSIGDGGGGDATRRAVRALPPPRPLPPPPCRHPFHTTQPYIYNTRTQHPSPSPAGRWLALQLAQLGREWRAVAARRMPEARGDIREIVGQPVFVPLYRLAQVRACDDGSGSGGGV